MSLATGRLATGTVRGATSMGISGNQIGQGITPTSLNQIGEGKITLTIYSFIRDGRFHDVIKILSNEVGSYQSRAALSLLGYCYYQVQEYHTACDWYRISSIESNIYSYEELVKLFPDNHDYRLYYAQSLYKSGQYVAAQKACAAIDNPTMTSQVRFLILRFYIRY